MSYIDYRLMVIFTKLIIMNVLWRGPVRFYLCQYCHVFKLHGAFWHHDDVIWQLVKLCFC